MIARRLALCAVACAVAAFAARASAGACPGPGIRVLPDGSAAVPTNVQVRLLFDAERVAVVELVDEVTRQIRKEGTVDAGAVDVLLETDDGAAVPVSLRRPPSTFRPVIIAAPTTPLAPRTRYAVIVRSGPDSYVVGRFATGDGPDTEPPAIGAVVDARFFRYPEPTDWKDPTGSAADVTFSGVDGAAALEVYALDGAGPPTDAGLRAIVEHRSGATVTLRDGGPCQWANFEFPDVPRGARAYPLSLGVRAVDAAGNASALVELTLDLAHPRMARKRR